MLDGAGRAGAGLVDGRLAQTARALPATAASARPSDREPLPRGMAGLALHYGVFGIGYIIPATFLPAMAKDVMPDPAVFGWAWPLFGLAAALSCLMVPKLARRHGEIRIWRGAQAAMALGMAVAALRHDLAAVIVAALLVGGTFMVITQAGMVAARRLAARRARAAVMTAAFAAGQIVGRCWPPGRRGWRQPAADAGGGRGAACAVGLGLGENHGRARQLGIMQWTRGARPPEAALIMKEESPA